MASSLPSPSFFKILLNPTDHSQLVLPDDFVTKHLQNKIPQDPIIQTLNGDYIWKLKIEKNGANYYFTNGWSDVVKEVKLGFGDVLLFRLIDKSTFRLLIYSPSGCPKVLPPKINVEQDIDSVGTVVDSVCVVDDDNIDDDDVVVCNVDDDDVTDDDDTHDDQEEDEDDKDEDYKNDDDVDM
ncbi:B3 domain-containing protein At3g18960-like [Rutidosis leptorrhynchoides]|uniref:B3 domain-containing protein At3g18960-like n=1 Tax=Rutidosis leptorrhynchoides TaxID=125765 RepID=UPI003A9A309F